MPPAVFANENGDGKDLLGNGIERCHGIAKFLGRFG